MERATANTAEPEVLTALRTLADANRLRLFLALREKERCVTDLVESEDLAQPLVSHHLRVLSTSGLVQARRSDGFTFYAVDPSGMSAALQAMTQLLDPATVSPRAHPGGNRECCR